MFCWFENGEAQNVERSLRMPTEEGPFDADQENALQDGLRGATFAMQTWDVTFHELTSCCLM
jgi:hypothetical protein